MAGVDTRLVPPAGTRSTVAQVGVEPTDNSPSNCRLCQFAYRATIIRGHLLRPHRCTCVCRPGLTRHGTAPSRLQRAEAAGLEPATGISPRLFSKQPPVQFGLLPWTRDSVFHRFAASTSRVNRSRKHTGRRLLLSHIGDLLRVPQGGFEPPTPESESGDYANLPTGACEWEMKELNLLTDHPTCLGQVIYSHPWGTPPIVMGMFLHTSSGFFASWFSLYGFFPRQDADFV